MQNFDFVVIGGGSAGYAAASTCARGGLSTAVIEGGAEVGGLCILRGCMPSKALLATSARAAAVRHAAAFGVHAQFNGIDGAAMQRRKRLLVADFAGYRRGQLESGKFTFIRGAARFLDAHTIEIRSEDGGLSKISARFVLIATGSTQFVPAVPGLREIEPLDSDAFLSREHIPKSIVILGGGAIALEAASFYSGAGVRVTLLQRSSRILKDADPDASYALSEGLVKNGINIRTNVRLLGASKSADGSKCIEFDAGGGAEVIVAEEVLHALGRVPATEQLELDAVQVEMNGRVVRTSPTQQTSQPHIFAAGDVCSPLQVVHLAVTQGEIAARNVLRLAKTPAERLEEIDYRLKMLAIFSEPGFASVGLSERELLDSGRKTLSATYPFNDHGKSMVEGCLDGFVKLVVCGASREILGATVVGPHAAELIHEIVVAMHFRATAGDLARIPHYHPTLSEIWTYPAEELA
jgi:pyruvate/2-oxoglutarate dehydrogenase complex dihydrolipoamide dehydrogenase (E3) component